MTDWRHRLREADRARVSELAPGTAQRLRRTVMAAAENGAARPAWSRPFALTAATLALICVALLSALPVERLQPANAPVVAPGQDDAAAADQPQATGRQQLQFATPGGTRIIWVFDSGFEVKGTVP